MKEDHQTLTLKHNSKLIALILFKFSSCHPIADKVQHIGWLHAGECQLLLTEMIYMTKEYS